MLQLLADLVEFDINRFTTQQIVEEFNHKFASSILKINGRYLYVKELTYNKFPTLYAENELGDGYSFQKIETIAKVLPKTGLYSSANGLLYLHRIPQRQWIKSLKLNANYRILKITGNPTLHNTVLTDNCKYNPESIIHDDKIYLHWKQVGTVQLDTIFVTNKNFFEEIRELWTRQYLVTLVVNRHQPEVENLIVDF